MATKTAMRFRTQYDPGDFEDYTRNEGPVLVDASCYETTETIISKLLRGEVHSSRFDPEYDYDDTVPNDVVFDGLDPSRRPGFDLADAAVIQQRGEDVKRDLKGRRKRKDEALPSTSADPRQSEIPINKPEAKL
nr:MAG: hypothetical protein [Microviridae sp.]